MAVAGVMIKAFGVQNAFAAADTGTEIAQGIDSTLAIALEMIAYGVRLDPQDRGDVLCRPTVSECQDGLDAVRLAFVPCGPVRCFQFGTLIG